MKILFAASEATPFAASGGLADVIGSLPPELSKLGNDVRVAIPLYKKIKNEYRKKMRFVTTLTVKVGWRRQFCEVFTLVKDNVRFYFIDSQYYFARDNLYGYNDDIERFVFFSRAVLDLLRDISYKPDIINCNDWQTALIPVFLEVFYKYKDGYEGIKTVFTIHNIQYQGVFGENLMTDLTGIPEYSKNILEYDGCVNLMKGAFETADRISTVSETYAKEILTPWYSHGLDRILVNKKSILCGILNGIDIDGYNPETDKKIPFNYSVKNLENKKKCKEALRDELGLNKSNRPLFAIITRLASHKGISLVRLIFEETVKNGAQFVILGSGDKSYEDFFLEMSSRYKGEVTAKIEFNSDLARKIYAAADIFLMPSLSEPCGLAQMIAMRYGTIPIVRETGGLKDTVKDFTQDRSGNGFTFKGQNAGDLQNKINQAIDLFYNDAVWERIMCNAMNSDFSWKKSSLEYNDMYRELLDEKRRRSMS